MQNQLASEVLDNLKKEFLDKVIKFEDATCLNDFVTRKKLKVDDKTIRCSWSKDIEQDLKYHHGINFPTKSIEDIFIDEVKNQIKHSGPIKRKWKIFKKKTNYLKNREDYANGKRNW